MPDDIAMPQEPFHSFQFMDRHRTEVRLLVLAFLQQVLLPLQAFGHVRHYRYSHGDVKPIQQMLSLRIQMELNFPNVRASIGKKCYLLVHRHSLRFQQLK